MNRVRTQSKVDRGSGGIQGSVVPHSKAPGCSVFGRRHDPPRDRPGDAVQLV
jgi:hypothetical protein